MCHAQGEVNRLIGPHETYTDLGWVKRYGNRLMIHYWKMLWIRIKFKLSVMLCSFQCQQEVVDSRN